jgi:hypothetical protein
MFSAATRRVRIAACLVPVALGIGACSPAAGAPAVGSSPAGTLHLYSKVVAQNFLSPTGAVLKQPAPTAGNQIDETDLDYVGTHSRHAKNWTGSDHLLCVFGSNGAPECHGDIAIGGSMILAEGTGSPAAVNIFKVTGGTGVYAGVTGTVTSTNIGNSDNSDFVITLHQG